MDFETRNRLILRIISSYQLIAYGSQTYKVYDPSSLDLYRGNLFYEEVLENLLLHGLPSIEFTRLLLAERNLWDSKKEDELDKLVKLIKDLQKNLPNLEFKSREKKEHLSLISQAKSRIEKLSREKNSLVFGTAEYIARIEKFKFLLSLTTYTENGEPHWGNYNEFCTLDDKVASFLVNKVYFDDVIDTITIRELARSDPWRNTWVSATKVSNLFSRALVDLTEVQKDLVTWSMIYDSVYESMETPGEDVINNDALLDAWFEQQHKKRQDSRNKDSFITNNDKIKNSQEISIMVDSPEDAQKVYNLNDRMSTQQLEANFAKIALEKEVKEINLPGKRKELLMQANNQYRDKMNANAH